MMFDTDVLIWVQRGNEKAARKIEESQDRSISILTYMELQQSAQDRAQLKIIKSFIHDFSFRVLPLTPEIGHRASIYVEEYTLSHAVRSGDAIIAATAIENGMQLCSGNTKHFRPIKELDFAEFRP